MSCFFVKKMEKSVWRALLVEEKCLKAVFCGFFAERLWEELGIGKHAIGRQAKRHSWEARARERHCELL
jgi:hypothetical protein